MNIESIVESPKDLHIGKHFDGLSEDGPQLLELRTESGSVYVRLSQWQRIRLLWTFRHFHVLPSQVLSRRDQHLIEGLSRSALVPQPLPAASSIIGVVEKPRTGSAGSVRQGRRTQGASPQTLRGKPLVRDEKPFRNESGSIAISHAAAVRRAAGMGNGFQQWGALGTLAALAVVVILARLYIVTLPARTAPRSEPPAVSRSVEQVAAQLSVVEKPKLRLAARVSAAALVVRKPAPRATASEPSVTGSSSAPAPVIPVISDAIAADSIAHSAAAERLFVSELPQGNFARPVVSDPNLVGEVELKALIGADGSIEGVSLVSGNPKLAQAGSRAIRRWHYSQEQGLGREAEALIRMSFFGPDAISVTSLAR